MNKQSVSSVSSSKSGGIIQDIFGNTKNNYFLQKLFGNLKRNKFLKIIKHNKKAQKILDININDYKEYSENYSSIELEIIPISDVYDKFINIKENEEPYFHIYFNDSKIETKRNEINKDEKVDKIKVIIDHQVKSFERLFAD